MSKLWGLNLDKFEIFGDVCTAQKHYAYIMMLWELRYVDEYVRAMVWERYCEIYFVKKDIVRQTSRVKLCEKGEKNNMYMYIGISYDNVGRMILWGKRSDNDIVQMKLWALRCANDDVRNKLWERRCEKHVETDIVRKEVWERLCRTDVVLS